jgi:hypothetical protein
MGKYQVSNAHFRSSHLSLLYDKTNYTSMYLHLTTREEYLDISVDIPLHFSLIINQRFSLYLLADSKLYYQEYSTRHSPTMISQHKAMFNFIWQRECGVTKLYWVGGREKVDQLWSGTQSTFRIHQ